MVAVVCYALLYLAWSLSFVNSSPIFLAKKLKALNSLTKIGRYLAEDVLLQASGLAKSVSSTVPSEQAGLILAQYCGRVLHILSSLPIKDVEAAGMQRMAEAMEVLKFLYLYTEDQQHYAYDRVCTGLMSAELVTKHFDELSQFYCQNLRLLLCCVPQAIFISPSTTNIRSFLRNYIETLMERMKEQQLAGTCNLDVYHFDSVALVAMSSDVDLDTLKTCIDLMSLSKSLLVRRLDLLKLLGHLIGPFQRLDVPSEYLICLTGNFVTDENIDDLLTQISTLEAGPKRVCESIVVQIFGYYFVHFKGASIDNGVWSFKDNVSAMEQLLIAKYDELFKTYVRNFFVALTTMNQLDEMSDSQDAAQFAEKAMLFLAGSPLSQLYLPLKIKDIIKNLCLEALAHVDQSLAFKDEPGYPIWHVDFFDFPQRPLLLVTIAVMYVSMKMADDCNLDCISKFIRSAKHLLSTCADPETRTIIVNLLHVPFKNFVASIIKFWNKGLLSPNPTAELFQLFNFLHRDIKFPDVFVFVSYWLTLVNIPELLNMMHDAVDVFREPLLYYVTLAAVTHDISASGRVAAQFATAKKLLPASMSIKIQELIDGPNKPLAL